VSAVRQELDIRRSVLYRWRDALLKQGEAGLMRRVGRPVAAQPGSRKPTGSREEQLQARVAELERKVGQQALYLDFFERAFKRVKGSNPANGSAGEKASTGRSKQ
jgi:transposase-like protein